MDKALEVEVTGQCNIPRTATGTDQMLETMGMTQNNAKDDGGDDGGTQDDGADDGSI